MLFAFANRCIIKKNKHCSFYLNAAFRGYCQTQRYPPLVSAKTGAVNQQTADFIRFYCKKWREKSLFQVLLHYRAARYHDFVNLAQQVHIYNQRIVAGLNKCSRAVPFERINTREVSAQQLGPMPIPTKKLPFRIRLDLIPFYDTQYMVDPANSMSRQTNSNNKLYIPHEDEEPWDSPLQRNPSMTSCLMTYNAYKKEQACQTNWDRIGDSDVIYNQNYYRDPQLVRRQQMQMNMNAYNNFNGNNNNYQNYNNYNHQHQTNTWGGNRAGSRRNSLKSYAAPPPPPAMPIMQQRNRMNPQQFIPTDPMRELKDIVRRNNDGDNSDDAPYNFKAMLRKTNYTRNEPQTYEYNSRTDYDGQQQQEMNFQTPKLRPTGRRYENTSPPRDANRFETNRATPKRQNSSHVGKSLGQNDTSFEEAGSYVEEEIAPGVTLSGYAVDI